MITNIINMQRLETTVFILVQLISLKEHEHVLVKIFAHSRTKREQILRIHLNLMWYRRMLLPDEISALLTEATPLIANTTRISHH